MAIREIITYPDKRLRQKCQPFPTGDLSDPDIGGTIHIILESVWRDMEDTLMGSDKGAALAAPQIGIMERLFVVNQTLTMEHGMSTSAKPRDPVVMSIPSLIINPRIVERSGGPDLVPEGCLSFPGFSMNVKRYRDVRVWFESLIKKDDRWELQKFDETYSGFWAQVFQHEIDHLDGKLFVDSLPENQRLKIAGMIRKNKGKKDA